MLGDLKQDCHFYLDLMWETKKERREVYRWLSRKMKIKGVHISTMNKRQLIKARSILRKEWLRRNAIKRSVKENRANESRGCNGCVDDSERDESRAAVPQEVIESV
jgi:hypothetical protein